MLQPKLLTMRWERTSLRPPTLWNRFLNWIERIAAKKAIAGTLQSLSTNTFPGIDVGEWCLYVFFSVTTSGNYPAGGDTFDFTAITPKGFIISSSIPLNVTLQSQSVSAGHSGYIYYYRPGTNQTNGKMQVLTTGGGSGQALAELAAGAYPAAITGDTIVGMATFVKNQ